MASDENPYAGPDGDAESGADEPAGAGSGTRPNVLRRPVLLGVGLAVAVIAAGSVVAFRGVSGQDGGKFGYVADKTPAAAEEARPGSGADPAAQPNSRPAVRPDEPVFMDAPEEQSRKTQAQAGEPAQRPGAAGGDSADSHGSAGSSGGKGGKGGNAEGEDSGQLDSNTGNGQADPPSGGSPRFGERVEVSDSGRTLTVYFMGGQKVCGIEYTAGATETPERVRISIESGDGSGSSGGSSQPCTMMAVERSETVHLNAPLGDRKVVKDGERMAVVR